MTDFIQITDRVLPPEFCTELIERFEKSDRKSSGSAGGSVDLDRKVSTDISIDAYEEWNDAVQRVVAYLYPELESYFKRYLYLLIGAISPSVVDPSTRRSVVLTKENFERLGAPHFEALLNNMYRCGSINLQKYDKNRGGYYRWHSETFPQDSHDEPLHRVLLWMFYLNDVEEGGETEFYYQEKKVSPKAGRCVIAPSGFTHTHRGNIPKSDDKYILTSWLKFKRAEELYGAGG